MQKKKKEVGRSLAKYLCPLTLCAVLVVSALPRSAAAQTDISVEDAIRFLEQTSFGANTTEIQRVQQMGYDGYLQDQFITAPSGWPELGLCPGSPDNRWCTPSRDYYTMYVPQGVFYVKALTGQDQLRQRVVFALDQMWVVSSQWVANFQTGWMHYYLSTLENNAFGNWRQLMYDVTLTPAMGKYLDMAQNYYVAGRAANENYAREVLQLFNVGLDELQDDGTPYLDGDGNRIPTYSQDTVIGFSKAFTGWNLQGAILAGESVCISFIPGQNCPNWRDPMIPVSPAANHDHLDKQLLPLNFGEDPVVLPARNEGDPSCNGNCAIQDLNDALDNIFNNHNVPVYVCKNFIQYLVTSNPSPSQVSNCVAAFKDNGQGRRGDMKAIITAIIMDPEARNAPDPLLNPNYGKLREPVLAITNILRNFNVGDAICPTTGNPCTDYVLGETAPPNGGVSIPYRMDEPLFQQPTVFNFFPPSFVVNVSGTPNYAPEFAIQSTTTLLGRINLMNALVYTGIPPSGTDRPYGTRIDPAQMAFYYQGDDGGLIDNLSQLMMHGTMSSDMRTLLVNEISGVSDPTAKAQKAVYLIAISPSYSVQR
jgi:uncharacterized protein (DUF1800 family)